MARRGSTAEIRVWFVPTIASALLIPTTAEITAGTDLTPLLHRDGLTTPAAGSTIDASDASSRFNKTAPGNIGGDALTMTFHRDSVTASDTAWTTLARDTVGYIVVRRFGGSALAAAAAQLVEVYKGTSISREMQPIGDGMQAFQAMWSIEADPPMAAALT